MVKIRRPADDGLSCQFWDFTPSILGVGFSLVLRAHGIERRGQPKGPWRKAERKERWESMDERAYHSGLSRPTSIPDDVIREAVMMTPVAINVGWTNAESTVAEFKHQKGN